jgi:predicted phosphodiesterase
MLAWYVNIGNIIDAGKCIMHRIGLLSDCHLETESSLERVYAMLPEPESVDVFLVAGDATQGPLAFRLCTMIHEYLKCPVLYTPGNHEFYYTHGLHCTLDEMEAECREEFAGHPDIHYLQGDAVTIGDVSYFGSTWWTNFRGMGTEYMAEAMAISNLVADFRYINIRAFSPSEIADQVNKFNRASGTMRGQAEHLLLGKSFHHKIMAQDMIDLNLKMVRKYRDWHKATPGKKVLMTHFPMLRELQHSGFAPSPYFVSADDLFIQQYPPDLIAFGHTHCNYQKVINGVLCVSNQYGYQNEETAYDPAFVVAV